MAAEVIKSVSRIFELLAARGESVVLVSAGALIALLVAVWLFGRSSIAVAAAHANAIETMQKAHLAEKGKLHEFMQHSLSELIRSAEHTNREFMAEYHHTSKEVLRDVQGFTERMLQTHREVLEKNTEALAGVRAAMHLRGMNGVGH